MGIFFPVSVLLTLPFAHAHAFPLETRRDRELQDILALTREASKQTFLTERSSQLNQLRRDYFERLARPDWAAAMRLTGQAGSAATDKTFAGLTAHLNTLFQFSENWQVQSSWLLSQEFKRFAPLQYRAASELPRLESAWLTYGKMRSVSLSAGLPAESSLLIESNTRSLFSGISVAIHPLEQKLTPDALQSAFELEHGWSSLQDEPRNGAERIEIQRTRPRLKLNWKLPGLEISIASGLEWYTDQQGKLRQLTGNRPDATEESKSSSESKWRLFSLQSQMRWQSPESAATLRFERVSNTLGANSTPAWSGALGGDIQILQNEGVLTGHYGATYYRSPAGALPAFRLPLEVNPGTQGVLMTVGASYFFSYNPSSTYALGLVRNLKRPLSQENWTTCSKGRQNTPDTCRVDWMTLAWSLKLPTNL
ncbi:MAG: hypothetical protein FJY29_02880 [Betaproteobacteria bacterium]|nr:hypothetical protein [Betaproteobacteria bacterium]